MQATSKGSDQTARMRRLICGFSGRTYHIVGNLMSRLICAFHSVVSLVQFITVGNSKWVESISVLRVVELCFSFLFQF